MTNNDNGSDRVGDELGPCDNAVDDSDGSVYDFNNDDDDSEGNSDGPTPPSITVQAGSYDGMLAIINLREFKLPKSIKLHLKGNTRGEARRSFNDDLRLQIFDPDRKPVDNDGQRLLACYNISVQVETRGDFGHIQWLWNCLGIYALSMPCLGKS